LGDKLLIQEDASSTQIVVTNLVYSKDPILQQNQAIWDAHGFFAIVDQEILCESERAAVYN
jgi:hypothetical protein